MNQSNGHYVVARAQQDDATDAPATAVADAAAPEYSFDGYRIDVSEKIALTPLAKHRHHRAPNGAPQPR